MIGGSGLHLAPRHHRMWVNHKMHTGPGRPGIVQRKTVVKSVYRRRCGGELVVAECSHIMSDPSPPAIDVELDTPILFASGRDRGAGSRSGTRSGLVRPGYPNSAVVLVGRLWIHNREATGNRKSRFAAPRIHPFEPGPRRNTFEGWSLSALLWPFTRSSPSLPAYRTEVPFDISLKSE